MTVPYDRLYIDGSWCAPESTVSRTIYNPATEEPLAVVADGSPHDALRAVRAAVDAQPSWASTTVKHRAEALRAIADGLASRYDNLLDTLIADVGTPRSLAKVAQLDWALAVFRDTANAIEARPERESVGTSIVSYVPLGVAALVTPWNYPLYQSALKVAPALAAGCALVLKPSELAPLALYILAEVVDEVGLPAGVFNLVPGPGESVGEALVGHREVNIVSFTGSPRAGRRVASLAGASLTPVSLELGGKGASLVLHGGDVGAAVRHAVGQCFGNAGQTCAAMTRLIVVPEHLTEVERLVTDLVGSLVPGDPSSERTTLGPVISAAQRQKVENYIATGATEGARKLVGGDSAPAIPERGYFVSPTVFTDVQRGMTIAQEEIFGPVLSIIPVDGQEDAVRVAESTRYGLTAAVWAGDERTALEVAGRLTTGSVTVNGGRLNTTAPFGGRKESGFGRERGRFGIEEFLTTKAYHI